MADVNGSGGATFGGLSSNSEGRTEWWHTTVDVPLGWVAPTTAPAIRATQVSWDASTHDVQLQVSAVDTFSSTVHDSLVASASGSSTPRLVTGLGDGGVYYARARSGDGTNWGPWSPTIEFTVLIDAGKAFLYSTLNVGVEVTPVDNWPVSIFQNVGVEITLEDNWPVMIYQNIGVEIATVDNWPAYVYENVTDDTPHPRIWFLSPAYGREGDGIKIYGFGFGDLQSTFSGVVQINWGGLTGWQAVPVISWQTFPATSDAYGPDRILDEVNEEIDMQHTIIEIIVPSGAIPPGYPVRVRTDGP